MIRRLLAKATEHDSGQAGEGDHVLWGRQAGWTNASGEHCYRVWDVGVATTLTRWSLGIEVNGEQESSRWPGWLMVALLFGPFSLYVKREQYGRFQ